MLIHREGIFIYHPYYNALTWTRPAITILAFHHKPSEMEFRMRPVRSHSKLNVVALNDSFYEINLESKQLAKLQFRTHDFNGLTDVSLLAVVEDRLSRITPSLESSIALSHIQDAIKWLERSHQVNC